MNTFNRVVMILLLLAIIVVMTVVLVVPRPVIEVVEQWLWNLDYSLGLLNPLTLLVVGVILALLVDVVCTVLLWLEIRRRHPQAIRVQRISGGQAELTVDSIARRLEHNINQLDGVVFVKPNVWGRRGGVEVELDLETSPEIDVPTKTEEVCQVAREAVEDRMGLRLRKIRVNIKYTPYSIEPPTASEPEHAPLPTEPPLGSEDTPQPPEPSMAYEDV